MKKMKFETEELSQKNIEKIGRLFPNCLTETRDENGKIKKAINFETLKQMLSEDLVESGDEAYEFTWVGKKEAMIEANKPIRKTLRPCKEESKDWDNTENLYIEGDNLEVLKLLQESYLNSIKMIYIDPPYNTGNDFIYNDDFKMTNDKYKDESGEVDEEGNRVFRNTNTNGRFHSDWCSMMYSRLMLARNLLKEDGVIFISIDDNEQENLKKICDEIFGESNFVANCIHKNNSNKNQAKLIGVSTEYFLIYTKNIDLLRSSVGEGWKLRKDGSRDICKKFNELKKKGFSLQQIQEDIKDMYKRPKYTHLSRWNKVDENGVFMDADLSREGGKKDYTIINPNTGEACPIPNRGWGKSYQELLRLQKENLIWYGKGNTPPRIKSYIVKDDFSVPDSFWYYDNSIDTRWIKDVFSKLIFENPKSRLMIKDMIEMVTNKESIVLDFFSGSATTAHAVMDLNAEDGGNRKFIMAQLPEECKEKSTAYKGGYKNICEIGKERIHRAGEKIKADNLEKAGIEELDIGFRVLKLDDTNMKDVYYAPDDYNQASLFDLESNIKEDRTELDLLYGCLIDWGLPLNRSYESQRIDESTVHIYNNGDLIACFDDNISEEAIKTIAKMEPLRAVFRDSSFKTSANKINVKEIFKLISPETSVRVI